MDILTRDHGSRCRATAAAGGIPVLVSMAQDGNEKSHGTGRGGVVDPGNER